MFHLAALSRTKGIVVVLDGRVEPGLLQVARVHALPVLMAPDANQAFRDILRLRPAVIIVHVPKVPAEALKLIRSVVESGLGPLPLIAATASHQDETERAVRMAGATCYLAGADAQLIGPVLENLLAARN